MGCDVAMTNALVIEDNKEIGEIYLMTLDMVGIQGELVVDGRLALERLEQIVPDLIILDMNLPQVSGHYLYKQIRSDHRMDGVPVIIATANTLLATALAGELGANDRLLVKPVSPKSLRDVVENLEGMV